jgi:hypothetical protein
MSAPTPWSLRHLHGAPMVVDARGYTVIPPGGVNAHSGDVPLRLLAQIVGAVNAVAENHGLARAVLEMDERGDRTPKRHHASSLLARAVACRRCETCGDPVPDDVVPAELVDGAIELTCARCEGHAAQAREQRLAAIPAQS